MYYGHKELVSDIYQLLSSIDHIYVLWLHTWNHKYMYYGHKDSKISICPGPVPKVGPRSYLSVVICQNKLSNVISGSFIIHQTEQTTSYFVIHPFQKMALCMISAMGKLGLLLYHSLIVIEWISKWGGTLLFSEVNFWKTVLSKVHNSIKLEFAN